MESNGNTNGQRRALVQRLNALPKLSEWVVDPMHSAIEFRVMHMGLVEVRGRFRQWQTKVSGRLTGLRGPRRGDRDRHDLHPDGHRGPRCPPEIAGLL